jgi:hypothetical protein
MAVFRLPREDQEEAHADSAVDVTPEHSPLPPTA